MGDQSAAPQNGTAKTACPSNVLQAIYGDPGDKKAAYENSLRRWWGEYADRKNDEEDEYVANSLLYDRNHLPRSAPAPWNVPPQPDEEQHNQQQPQEQEQATQ